jgi:DNA modification methylase
MTVEKTRSYRQKTVNRSGHAPNYNCRGHGLRSVVPWVGDVQRAAHPRPDCRTVRNGGRMPTTPAEVQRLYVALLGRLKEFLRQLLERIDATQPVQYAARSKGAESEAPSLPRVSGVIPLASRRGSNFTPDSVACVVLPTSQLARSAGRRGHSDSALPWGAKGHFSCDVRPRGYDLDLAGELGRAMNGALDIKQVEHIREPLLSSSYTTGLTHHFYHYPARFSPEIARALISTFSVEGDWVLDPFMGGGTSIIEGLALGRNMVGVDLNALGHFVTDVRTTPLSVFDKDDVREWARRASERGEWDEERAESREAVANLPRPVEAFVAVALDEAGGLLPRQRAFARCALLRLGQWALDCRDFSAPRRKRLARRLPGIVDELLEGLDEFTAACLKVGVPSRNIRSHRLLLNRRAEGLECDPAMQGLVSQPRLVVTSPPYPGVHVLYHRWQYRGRKETPAPYWIANVKDGMGEAYYAGGSRTPSGLRNYFRTIREAFTSVRRVIASNALVIQLVGFSDASTQLPTYLQTMEEAGFDEIEMPTELGGRLERRVPNRKWYAKLKGTVDASLEIMLVHRPR